MKTTLNKIKQQHPCADGWKKLLTSLGKTKADDDPLSITSILDSNGLNDTLWCLRAVDGHDKEIRLYAVWCARKVHHLTTDPRSKTALDVAERYAHGLATAQELDAAGDAARAAARAARAAARDARDAAWAAAGAARDAAWAAAGDAARDAAWAAQEAKLRRICAEGGSK